MNANNITLTANGKDVLYSAVSHEIEKTMPFFMKEDKKIFLIV